MMKKKAKKKVPKKSKYIIELSDDAAKAFKAFQRITKRSADETASDAFRTYMWVLYAQTFGGIVETTTYDGQRHTLERLDKDTELARKYLARYHHLMQSERVNIQEG